MKVTIPVAAPEVAPDATPMQADAPDTKICERCLNERTLSTFALKSDGRVAVCRVCTG